jgi:phage gpG-like protein
MAGLTLSFSIEGETALLRKLEGVEQEMKNWYPEFRKTGDMLQKTFRDNFDTEGSMLGKPWQPLAVTTVTKKARHGYPPDVLVRTGKMKNAFRSQPNTTYVEIDNPTPYFVYHQSRQPRQKLPRRIMMHLDEKRKQMIVKIFQSAVAEKLKRRGFNA